MLAFETSGSLPAKFREVPDARLFCIEDLVQSTDHTCYTVVNPLMENPAFQHIQCKRAGREDKDMSKATKKFMENTVHLALCKTTDSCQCEEMWIMQSRTDLLNDGGKVYSYRLGRVVVWMYFPADGVNLVVPPSTVDTNNAGNGDDSVGGRDLVHEAISIDLAQQVAFERTLDDFFNGFLTSSYSTPAASSSEEEDNCFKRTRLMDD